MGGWKVGEREGGKARESIWLATAGLQISDFTCSTYQSGTNFQLSLHVTSTPGHTKLLTPAVACPFRQALEMTAAASFWALKEVFPWCMRYSACEEKTERKNAAADDASTSTNEKNG